MLVRSPSYCKGMPIANGIPIEAVGEVLSSRHRTAWPSATTRANTGLALRPFMVVWGTVRFVALDKLVIC